MRIAFSFVLMATVACGGTTTTRPTAPATTPEVPQAIAPEPTAQVDVSAETEPEPEPEAEPEPPSMEPVELGEQVTLGCGQFVFQLPHLGDEEDVRVESHSCDLDSSIESAGWIGTFAAQAHAIVGPCDIYLSMDEDSGQALEICSELLAHPNGTFVGFEGREGIVCRNTDQLSSVSIAAEADRDSCVPVMHQVILAAAQSLQVPPMPEDRRVRIPVSARGHNILITVPEEYVLYYTGKASEEYEFSWWLRPLEGGPGIRFFGYNPGGSRADLGNERLMRSRALGAQRTFILSPGGGFIEEDPRGLAFVRAPNRRAELMISIPAEDSPERVVLLEALSGSRWGSVVAAPTRRGRGTSLPGDEDGIIPTR